MQGWRIEKLVVDQTFELLEYPRIVDIHLSLFSFAVYLCVTLVNCFTIFYTHFIIAKIGDQQGIFFRPIQRTSDESDEIYSINGCLNSLVNRPCLLA